eukprot:g2413.t1
MAGSMERMGNARDQLLLACSGAERDPENPMRWIGPSVGHLMLLSRAEAENSVVGELKPLCEAEVGCNTMASIELPTSGTGTESECVLALTDMSDPRCDGKERSGCVRLFRASSGGGGREAFLEPLGRHHVAMTAGRSPCALALCPEPLPALGELAKPTFVVAVACYEGEGGATDGVVSLLSLTTQSSSSSSPATGGGWQFGTGNKVADLPGVAEPINFAMPTDVALHDAASAVGGGATPGQGRQDAAHPHGVEWWLPSLTHGTSLVLRARDRSGRTPSVRQSDKDPLLPRLLFVADLGANKVIAYEICVDGVGKLAMHVVGITALHVGAGPRHLRVLPHSECTATIFVVNELDNTMSVLSARIDAATRQAGPTSCSVHMTILQCVSTLPSEYDGKGPAPFPFYTAPSHACAIILDNPNPHTAPFPRYTAGREPQLFVSNRGHDSIATFRVVAPALGNGWSCRVELIGHNSCSPGRLPWDLSLDRTGRVAAVSTQFDEQLQAQGGSIALFDRVTAEVAQRVSCANVLMTRFLRGGVPR